MTQKSKSTPSWYEGETPSGTYRALFKWNDPNAFKHPNRGFYQLLQETLEMGEEEFTHPRLALEPFDQHIKPRLSERHIQHLRAIVGEENAHLDTYTRTHLSYGAGMFDALRLRHHIVENLPDLVLAPRSQEEIEAIVRYCDRQRIALFAYGGGSSVTRGAEAVKGGVSLDLSVHMNKVVAFSETNQTITVQAGMWGPQLEHILNNAPQTLGAEGRYTCGHFPQSFEHSSVGGWVVTRGAGQNSTYYGKIEDMVRAQVYVTPAGVIRTLPYPRAATGPDLDQILIGSEGCFGILTQVTLRVCKYQPQTMRRFSYLFKNWEEALKAYREVMQGEFGFPSVFRLSDPEETDVAMRIYSIHNSPADRLLRTLGYQPMQRCLLLGSTDGDAQFSRLVKHKIHAICRSHHAFTLTPFGVTQRWEHSRFTDPYMREDLMDFGIMIDTLECAVTWEQVQQVHSYVRQVVKSRPRTICMTHLSHAYPQGTNLYFIFIAKTSDINEYLTLQYSVLEAIQKSGASMSHHHGVGKQTAPWLEDQIGKPAMEVIRALKQHFDPHNILNPGGTLGLDMSEEQKKKRWGFRS